MDLTLINLTNDIALRPAKSAVQLFEHALKCEKFYFKHSFEESWKNWLHTDEEISEELIARHIPIFIVDRSISGQSMYVPALGQDIPIPEDLLPNIQVNKKRDINNQTTEKQDRPICQCVGTNDCPYSQDRESNDAVECRIWENVICPLMGIIDVWGCFTVINVPSAQSHDPRGFNGMPAIFLWMDKITESTDDLEERNMLFAKVLLHELAHALMHLREFGSGDFYKWNEESLANAYALSKIKETGNAAFYDFAKDVVLNHQPANYALGAKYTDDFHTHTVNDFINCWMNIKRGLDRVPDLVKERWLKYVQSATILCEKELHHFYKLMTDDVYLYNDELYLDKEVAWAVMRDYTVKHPEMTLAEIQAAFPDSLNQHFTMYDIWPNGADYEASKKSFRSRDTSHLRNNISGTLQEYDETRFFYEPNQILHAADTDFVISDYWHTRSMPEFIKAAAKVGIKITKL